MTYRLTSGHVEPLHDGRLIGPGDTVSDADAKKNPLLLERGVLTKEPEKAKRADKTGAGDDATSKDKKKEESQ